MNITACGLPACAISDNYGSRDALASVPGAFLATYQWPAVRSPTLVTVTVFSRATFEVSFHAPRNRLLPRHQCLEGLDHGGIPAAQSMSAQFRQITCLAGNGRRGVRQGTAFSSFAVCAVGLDYEDIGRDRVNQRLIVRINTQVGIQNGSLVAILDVVAEARPGVVANSGGKRACTY